MKITKDLLVKYGVCSDGLNHISEYYSDVEHLIDGEHSHRMVYENLRKYFIENINDLNREEWLENGKWLQMLRTNPQAIIDGGHAKIGEQYKAVSFNFEKVFPSIEEARAALEECYAGIKSDPMSVANCFYWKNVDAGKQTERVYSISDLRDGMEYNVFNSSNGTYDKASSLSDVLELILAEQTRILDQIKSASVIEVSVRDTVDNFLCWMAEEQYEITENK